MGSTPLRPGVLEADRAQEQLVIEGGAGRGGEERRAHDAVAHRAAVNG